MEVSAKTGEGADVLIQHLMDMLNEGIRESDLILPYSDAGVLDLLRREAQILSAEYTENGILVKANLSPELLGRFKKYVPGWEAPLEEWER